MGDRELVNILLNISTALAGIQHTLDKIVGSVNTLNQKEAAQMGALDDINVQLDDLQATVDASAAGEASALALLNGLAAKVDELVAAGGDPTATLAKIAALSTELKDSAAALAAGVAADAR